LYSKHEAGGVAARPLQTVDEAGAHRVRDDSEHDRHAAGRLQQRRDRSIAIGHDHVRGAGHQFGCGSASIIGFCPGPTDVELHIAADGPAQLLQALGKCCDPGLAEGIPCSERHEHADAPHALALLRARRERPRGHRTAEQRDELAAPS